MHLAEQDGEVRYGLKARNKERGSLQEPRGKGYPEKQRLDGLSAYEMTKASGAPKIESFENRKKGTFGYLIQWLIIPADGHNLL